MADAISEHASAERLRILFVTADKFPPFRPAAKCIFADGVTARGHEVDWLLQAESAQCAAGAQSFKRGVAFVAPTNDGRGRLSRLMKHWAAFVNDLKAFRLLREHEYSLVQIKDKYAGALAAIAAAKLRRVPIFYWLAYPHGEASSYAAEHGIARYSVLYSLRGAIQEWLLRRVILPASDHVFVQSERMLFDLCAKGVPRSKMTPVPSSVNLDEMDAAEAEPGPPLPPNTIVYLGTLLRERRLDMLVRALARVRTHVPNARLLFVGAGENAEDEALLRREADRLGVGAAVSTTGWVSMRAAWKLARKAAVCVSPYFPTKILQSTSPTKLVEYMALRRPVVANAHPEQSAVIARSGCGLVCSWGDKDFAEALVRILSDPAGAEAMGAAGRRFVERERTYSVMVDLVLDTYRERLRVLRAAASAEELAAGTVSRNR